jgi:transcriptional regulator with XRE-family HTH domain
MASRMEIEDSALRRIESGRTNPTLKTLLLISEALGVNISYLLE